MIKLFLLHDSYRKKKVMLVQLMTTSYDLMSQYSDNDRLNWLKLPVFIEDVVCLSDFGITFLFLFVLTDTKKKKKQGVLVLFRNKNW